MVPKRLVWKSKRGARLLEYQFGDRGKPYAAGEASNAAIDVVIVPDEDLQRGKPSQTAALLNLLRNEAKGARVFEFDQMPWDRTEPIWHSIVESGDDLADALGESLNHKDKIRPLLFVSYGFGGIIVKRALSKLHDDKAMDGMLRLVQHGIAFFGVPHLPKGHREKWSRLNDMLKAYGTFKNEYLDSKAGYLARIADVCANFEEISTDGPILSIYETLETKKGSWIPFRSRKSLLVGQEMAAIWLRDEKLLESQADYFGVCKFRPGSVIYNEVSQLIRSAAAKEIRVSPNTGTITVTGPATTPQGKTHLWASTDSNVDSTDDGPTPSGSSYPTRIQAPSQFSNYEFVPNPTALVTGHMIPSMPCYIRKSIERNPNFVGRSEIIAHLDGKLLPTGPDVQSPRSFSLCGFGGIGKTQVASFYAFAREDQFDAIFWVQADEQSKIAKSFDDIARGLDLTVDADQDDKVVSRNRVLQWLSYPLKQQSSSSGNTAGQSPEMARWLLIFDNVDDIKIVRDYWPDSGAGSILITTRDPFAKTDWTTDGIDLEPMPKADCALLLQKLAREPSSPEADDASLELANQIGRVPLAISQIATHIRRGDMTIAEFLARYGGGPMLKELDKVESLPPQEQYKFTLSTVWGLETFDSNTLGLLHVLVFLDVDEIAETILEQAITSSAKYPAPGGEFVDARKALSSNSILRRNKQTKSLSWHRLIRDVAMSKMPRKQMRPYFELAVDLLHGAWRFAADRFSREEFKKEECDKVLPHVESVLVHYKRVLPVDPLSTRSARQLVKLLQEAGWYLVQGAQHETARPMFELAMQICESHGAEMMDLLADTCFSFARYGEETNMNPQQVFDYCFRFHALSLQLDDNTQKGREDVATSHTSLAQGYLLLDQFQPAIDHCEQCISLEATLPDVQSGDAIPQFAFIYQAWGWLGLGDYGKAADLASQVIQFRKIKFGANDKQSIKLGLALHCLGNAQARQNKRAESLQSYMKALTNFRQILGPNDFRVGQVNLKIAEQFAAMGSAQPAGLYFSQAIDIFKRIPYYKPELARAYFKHHIFIQSRKNPESSSSSEDASYSRAVELYKQLKPQHTIPRRLEEHHFDALVRFWSR